jgi:hypothetical protein
MPLADAFLNSYPIGTEGLSIYEFDEWAENEGHYEGVNLGSLAEVSTARNRLRGRINSGGVAPFRAVLGDDCFEIVTDRSGRTLKVIPVSTAVVGAAEALPKQIARLTTHKREKIDRLIDSVDFDRLPPMERMRLEDLREQCADFEETTQTVAQQLLRKLRATQQRIAKLNLADESGAIRALLDNSDA